MDDSITRRSTTGELVIPMPVPEPSETAPQPPSWFGSCWRMLHHVHVVILLGVYGSLIGLLQLKYQSSKKETAFETHSFFMFMSVAAIIIFALTYWILHHTLTKNNFHTNDQQLFNSPSILQMILVSVAFFSILLALLSLVFVLLLPPNLMWIGYSATSLLFISTLSVVTSLGKNMFMTISKLVNYIKDKF